MSFARRLAAGSAAAILSLGLAAVPARAQAPDTDKKVTVNLKDIPLRAAIDALFAGTGQQYTINPDVANVPVNLNIKDIGLKASLRLLLRQAAIAQPGLTFNDEAGVIVVKVRKESPQPTAAFVEDAPPALDDGDLDQTWEKIPVQFNNVAVFVLAFGGTMLPSEADVLLGGLGGGFGGNQGGGFGNSFGGGGGFGNSFGGGGGFGNSFGGGGSFGNSFGGGGSSFGGGSFGNSFGGGGLGNSLGGGSFGNSFGGGGGNFGGGRRF